jgi:magnesium-transporting ATPase (P-type)
MHKGLIGRYLFLRIVIAAIVLTSAVIGSVFTVKSMTKANGEPYSFLEERGQALNTLNNGAIAVTLSARFAYNSSFHPRIFGGNPFCWWSVLIMVSLQVFITYTPWVNTKIFSQTGLNGIQWAITLGFTIIVFIVMEFVGRNRQNRR